MKKTLEDDIEDVGNGQVKNSVLQVRTRAGGSSSDDATVAYPVAVYVFQGDECSAVQTIGDEGQTLNIPLVEGTYSVYAVGGASALDYVLPDASRWRHKHRHAGHDKEDDAHPGRDYQEDSDGGDGGERNDCPFVAEPDHWGNVQHDERKLYHCANAAGGWADVAERCKCFPVAAKQSVRQREREHHYWWHDEDIHLFVPRPVGGWVEDQH